MSVIYLLILYTERGGGNGYFYVKSECKASVKREKKKVTLKLNRRNGKFESCSCTCPAGNLVMGILFEIADYSLHQLSRVPDEILRLSCLRQ